MASRMFCNGCGREVEDGPENRHDEEGQVQRFHVVEARRASIAGSGQPLGIAGEATVRGDLCDNCWHALAMFVGAEWESRGVIEAEPGAALAQV